MTQGMHADRLILSGAVSTGAGFLVRFGARILFLLVAGRLFGPVLFGAFALALAVVEASISLGGLAMKKLLFQMLDERVEQPGSPHFHTVLDAALLVFLTSAAIGAAIMAAAMLLPPTLLSPATATALFWLAPMVAGQGVLDVLLASTRWQHSIRYEVIGRSMVEPYSLLAAAAAAWFLGFREHGLLIGYWVGNTVVTLYALAGAKRCFGTFGLAGYRPRARELWHRFRFALPNTATDLLTGIFIRMDLFLVGMLLGERWAGIYGMAHQIRTPIRHVRQAFDGVLTPFVTKTLAARGAAATREALATASRFILAAQMPFVVGIVAIGVPLLELFGPGFGAGYLALLLLVIAEVVQSAFSLGDLLFVYRKPGTGLAITALSLVLGAMGALLLIPFYGIAGAALAVLIAQLVQAMLRRRLLKSQLGASVPLAHDALPLAAGAVGLAAVLLLIDRSGTHFDGRATLTLLAGLGAYGCTLAVWLKATGQSLSIRGFRAEAESS
jgi:O-antigen/teichoic acid export membrane protein